ncbi:hypothetical protein EYF80_041175 [Liparis tanakae]|uniref:Uncharacterized protein n=1 Tax=Liparis tanakae TaxID=230148 RepID=A0A4Z2G4X9_9TELE|nr:hypothetical protein EYF80_041175 [Liparis tanakae]
MASSTVDLWRSRRTPTSYRPPPMDRSQMWRLERITICAGGETDESQPVPRRAPRGQTGSVLGERTKGRLQLL